MVKDFNMKENSATAWLRWDELNNETKFNADEMGFRYGIGCFDLAETTDLASAKVLLRKDMMIIFTFFLCTGFHLSD